MFYVYIKWISVCITFKRINILKSMFSKIVYFFILFASIAVKAERLHEQIYSSIDGTAACFRRLNGTHQAGCSSSNKGAVGIVQMVNSVSDAQWIVFNSTAGQYMAIVSTYLLHDVVNLFIDHPQNVAGILLYQSTNNTPKFFSQESRCPNEYTSGPGSKCSSAAENGVMWNEYGTGLIRRDIPFPIFYLSETHSDQINKIQVCYEKFNLDKDNQKGQPLCSVQLNSFMFAAVSSELCLRRSTSSALMSSTKMCDPLGDQNVYYSLFPRTKENKTGNRTVTLMTARIDSASLFDGFAPGGATSVVGMVTLIAAASTLAKMIPLSDAKLYNHNILWTLFNGEAFDYIGSQRVAFDLNRGVWPPNAPLPISQIKLHVEVGQIGGSLNSFRENRSWPLHAFIPNNVTTLPEVPEINEFLNIMKKYTSLTSEFNMNLPPSSLHSFRRILKSGQMPELLLVDHHEKFENIFYQSVLDDYKNIGFNYHNISIDNNGTFLDTDALIANNTMKESEMQVKIARLATALSYTLYEQITKNTYMGNITASAHLVDEMLYCFMKSQACRLILAADFGTSSTNKEDLPERPISLYVSVLSWPSTVTMFAGHLLALLTGNVVTTNHTKCISLVDSDFNYYWLRGWNHSGVCVQTTMNFTQALSPAFMKSGYDFTSGVYSTWTESIWQEMWARLFVRAGGGGARAAALVGAVATVLATVLTFWMQKYSQLIFITTPTSNIVTINNDATTGILRTVNC